jgi:hypothetical protein
MTLFVRYDFLYPGILLATVLQNYHGLSMLMSEGSLSLFKYEGPFIYKILKDIIYIFLFALICFHAFKIRRLPLSRFSGCLVVLISAMIFFSAIDNGPLIGMIGLRWIFPFILFILMKDWGRLVDRNSALPWMLLGLICCLVVQIFQFFFMPPVFGEIFSDIPARVPGFFVAPNSAAFFACASAACVMVFAPFKLRLNLCAIVLALVISLLAQSGTGMVASVLLALRLLFGRQHVVFWVVALFVSAIVIPNLDLLTMRDDYVELSGGGRVDALLKIANDSALSISHFGLYTNTANLLSANPEDQMAPDSLIASWVGNFGVFASVAILLSALFVRYGMRAVDWSRAMPCVLVFGVFSLTTIVFEAFPMNLYLALGVWSAWRPTRTTSCSCL